MSREPVLATAAAAAADAPAAADAGALDLAADLAPTADAADGAPAPPAGTLDLAPDAPAPIGRNARIVGEFFFKSDFHWPVTG